MYHGLRQGEPRRNPKGFRKFELPVEGGNGGYGQRFASLGTLVLWYLAFEHGERCLRRGAWSHNLDPTWG